MFQNPIAYIGLAAVVVVMLIVKGYIRLPRASSRPSEPSAPANSTPPLDSKALGVLWAQALKREADEEIAATIANQAGQEVKAKFTNPFGGPDKPVDLAPESKT